ncbi:NFACT RNA binding domain-containing protein [Leuconostoc gelidum]|uniref:NFACT RNA binding domain-containing protein n=1 Tax=Leuconostoc gelidum TaxID=1244 RepID=UPI001CC47B9F|nr:NFACT RNA binding domain-containing protein [Leuconostoc gelidum]MBZ5992295.1 NFACT family protein [Leuconostoc gelidum subsp. gelidum]USP16700.1 NFACT family protein [Leuconostoc gelidum subsp. aenigmaticum]
MPLDGLFTHALVHELNELIVGGRITKVHQPYPNEIVLVVRNNSVNYPVLLSAHPTYARTQITHIPYENPQTAPNFVMFLRRYLEGAKLQKIEQVENDRIINFYVNARNELGDIQQIRLTLEMMGRHSNLFLIRETDSRILELIKHVPADQNRVRSLMPGATYVLPPAQNLKNPFITGALEALAPMILDTPFDDWSKFIQSTYQGFGRDSAQVLAQTINQDGDHLAHANNWLARFNDLKPTLFTAENGTLSYAAFDWLQDYATSEHFHTLGDMLDAYYIGKAERERVNQQAGSLVRVVKNELKKNNSKRKKLLGTLDDATNADDLKVMGDLLITYPHLVQKGMTSIEIENYYDNNRLLKISLDPKLNGLRNAEKYFTKYRKLRTAVAYVNEQMTLTDAEIDYFNNIVAQLDVASPKDVEDIRLELTNGGYIRANKKNKQKPKVSKPDKFESSDGTLIEVGKNNLQNERLSLKQADRRDIWLHVQKIPGSHVIIHSANPSDETLVEAAKLAGYFSKARDSANIPVDYLPAGKLRKPNGSKPGFVIFEGQQTMYVTPDANLVSRLKIK